jgi:hypothetical protein
MTVERKLLVGPDPDGSTFAKAFGKAAGLPTEEDRDKALEMVGKTKSQSARPKVWA